MERHGSSRAALRADVDMLIGGRYRLLRPIRGGGVGTVWEGRDERLGRPVAVKILHGTLDGDADARARFRREAIAASRVSHPAIASVYDYVEEHDRRAIVMELVEGETLAARIARRPLAPDAAREIFAHVLSALHAAHATGVLHRDVKPSNILLTRAGAVKVADFGVASIAGDATVTATGTIMATPQYAAPEQLRGERSTPATDVYQTGVALYESLTGRLPFRGDTPITMAMARLSTDPEPLHVPGDLPLAGIVMKALARDPSQRYSSAAQMRAAILGADATPLPAAPEDPATMRLPVADEATVSLAAPPRARRAHRLRRIAALGALVALVIAVMAVGLIAAFSKSGAVVVPRLTDRPVTSAVATAEGLDLAVATVTRSRPGVAAGTVFAQEPPAGTRLEPGDTVRLIVADGCCIVPDLARMDGAAALLDEARLTAGRVTYVRTSDVPAGTILSQDPLPGAAVAPGTPVDMTVAQAPPELAADNRDEDTDGGKGKGKRGRDDDD